MLDGKMRCWGIVVDYIIPVKGSHPFLSAACFSYIKRDELSSFPFLLLMFQNGIIYTRK